MYEFVMTVFTAVGCLLYLCYVYVPVLSVCVYACLKGCCVCCGGNEVIVVTGRGLLANSSCN